MITPHCARGHQSLLRQKNQGKIHYHCPQCLGVATTMSALKGVVEQKCLSALWRETFQTQDLSLLSCPFCRKKMWTVLSSQGGSHVELDVCPRCYAVWLDHGELAALPAARQAPVLEPKSPSAIFSKEKMLRFSPEERRTLAEFELKAIKGEQSYFESTGYPGAWQTAVTLVGFPVEESCDDFSVQPWLTWLLIGSCALISFSVFNGALALETFAFHPTGGLVSWIVQGISSFFVHAGLWHLFGNMYILWVFGDNVEDDLGKADYLILVATATLVGSWAYGLLMTGATIPLVGASGGISGIVAYYLVRFPQRRFTILFFIRWFSIRSWVFAAFYFGWDIVGAFLQLNGRTSVSHITHLGGIAVGLTFAFWKNAQLKNFRT